MNGTYEYSLAQIQNLPTTEALPADGSDEFTSHRGFTPGGDGDGVITEKMEDFYGEPPQTPASANGASHAPYPSPSPPTTSSKKQSRRTTAAQVAQAPQPAIVLSPQGAAGSAGSPQRHMSMAAALGAHHFYPGPPHPPSHIPPYALAAAGHAHYLSAFKGNTRSRGAGYRQARSSGAGLASSGYGAGGPSPMFMHPPTVKWPDPCMGGMPMTAAAAAAYHGVDPGKLLLRPCPSDFAGGPGVDFGYKRGEGGSEDAGGGDGDEGGDGGEVASGDGGTGSGSPTGMAGYSDTVKRYTVDAHNQVGRLIRRLYLLIIRAQHFISAHQHLYSVFSPLDLLEASLKKYLVCCAGDERVLCAGFGEPVIRSACHSCSHRLRVGEGQTSASRWPKRSQQRGRLRPILRAGRRRGGGGGSARAGVQRGRRRRGVVGRWRRRGGAFP